MGQGAVTTKRTLVIRLEKGDEVIGSLGKACAEKGIKSGIISGIGALAKCRLYASRSVDRLEPEERDFDEPLEIACASGNITQKEGRPHVHLHVVLGRVDQSCVAGHLINGTVSLTGEFWITEVSKPIGRKRDEETGIDLLAL